MMKFVYKFNNRAHVIYFLKKKECMCVFNTSIQRFALFIFFICLFLCTGKLQAQLRVGPKTGFQMAKQVFADKEYRDKYTSGFRPGFNIGAVLNYKVNDLYSLETELFYSQKGKVSRNTVNFVDDVRNRATYHFLDLPIMLRLSKLQNYRKYKVEYYANVGPSLNYWLGGSGDIRSAELVEFLDTDSFHYTIAFKETDKFGDYYIPGANRFQMSLDFGGGVLFNLGTGQLIMVDLRSSIGVGKTFMGEQTGVSYGLSGYEDNFKAVNHIFALSIAYLVEIDMRALVQKGRIRR